MIFEIKEIKIMTLDFYFILTIMENHRPVASP
jgi:hypothetical protein